MSNFKKIIATTCLSLSLCGTILPVLSNSTTYADKTEITTKKEFFSDNLTKQDLIYLKKFQNILNKFTLSEKTSGKLLLNISKKDLITIYSFTEDEANSIINSVKFAYLPKKINNKYQDRLHIANGKIYFNNSDVVTFLSSAAQIGPAAIYGALVGLGSVSLGPVGTAVVAGLGIIGAPGLAGFTYQVIQAVANRQGVYIGVEFNGIFPNVVSGTW